jgi:hypothetical protein
LVAIGHLHKITTIFSSNPILGDFYMSDTDKAVIADKAKNYSAEQEAAIVAASPLNLEKAKELAVVIGKGWRSIISKAQTVEMVDKGVIYNSKAPAPKRPVKETKAEIVAEIFATLSENGVLVASFDGLDKATTRALVNLRQAITVT